jgi:hypothetical protein
LPMEDGASCAAPGTRDCTATMRSKNTVRTSNNRLDTSMTPWIFELEESRHTSLLSLALHRPHRRCNHTARFHILQRRPICRLLARRFNAFSTPRKTLSDRRRLP